MSMKIFREKDKKDFDGKFEFGELKYYNQKDSQKVSQKDVWYSYDCKSHNIHIAPEEICEQIEKKFDDIVNTECETIIENQEEFKNMEFYSSTMTVLKKGNYFVQKGNKPEHTKNHLYRYIRPQGDGFEYLILVNRYWCSDGDNDKPVVNCKFGSFQFVRNRIVWLGREYIDKLSNINYDSNYDFQIMYPYTKEDGYCVYNPATGHCVYNSFYNLGSDSKDVAKGFIDFVLGFKKPLDMNKKHNHISLDMKGIEIRNA